MLERLKRWAAELRTQLLTLWFCRRHPDTPWAAKLLVIVVVAYALSPIDLIPDFIPVLGYLDDLVIVPAGIALLVKIIPPDVLEECRSKAQSNLASRKPKNWVAAVIIVLIWLFVIFMVLSFPWPLVTGSMK